jgi:hypothetical protein
MVGLIGMHTSSKMNLERSLRKICCMCVCVCVCVYVCMCVCVYVYMCIVESGEWTVRSEELGVRREK